MCGLFNTAYSLMYTVFSEQKFLIALKMIFLLVSCLSFLRLCTLRVDREEKRRAESKGWSLLRYDLPKWGLLRKGSLRILRAEVMVWDSNHEQVTSSVFCRVAKKKENQKCPNSLNYMSSPLTPVYLMPTTSTRLPRRPKVVALNSIGAGATVSNQ